MSWREEGNVEEKRRGREEERRPCLKRAVEINHYVYVLEEQSVLLEQKSTPLSISPWTVFTGVFFFFFCASVSFGTKSRPVLLPLKSYFSVFGDGPFVHSNMSTLTLCRESGGNKSRH